MEAGGSRVEMWVGVTEEDASGEYGEGVGRSEGE